MPPAVDGVKGMVLAAGLGTRLRPLTDLYPKPLIPFCGTTPLELALWRLDAAGVRDVAVNAHWKAEQVEAVVQRNPFGLRLQASVERGELLGTGGCYNPLRGWQGASDLVVINGDVVTDVDVAGLLERHRAAGAVATMALLPAVIPGESAVFHRDGRVTAIGKPGAVPADAGEAGNFACVQVLSRAFVDLLPPAGSFDVISKGYLVALDRGLPVGAFLHRGRFWHDLRSPAFYWQAVRDYLALDEDKERVGVAAARARLERAGARWGTVYCSRAASVPASAKLGPEVVVEAGATVGAEARVRRAVLLPGAVVEPQRTVSDVILGPGVTIPLA